MSLVRNYMSLVREVRCGAVCGVGAENATKKPPGFHPRRKSSQSCRDYFSAATPACDIVSSCEPAPPDTPMAPTILPPTIRGLPRCSQCVNGDLAPLDRPESTPAGFVAQIGGAIGFATRCHQWTKPQRLRSTIVKRYAHLNRSRIDLPITQSLSSSDRNDSSSVKWVMRCL